MRVFFQNDHSTKCGLSGNAAINAVERIVVIAGFAEMMNYQQCNGVGICNFFKATVQGVFLCKLIGITVLCAEHYTKCINDNQLDAWVRAKRLIQRVKQSIGKGGGFR